MQKSYDMYIIKVNYKYLSLLNPAAHRGRVVCPCNGLTPLHETSVHESLYRDLHPRSLPGGARREFLSWRCRSCQTRCSFINFMFRKTNRLISFWYIGWVHVKVAFSSVDGSTKIFLSSIPPHFMLDARQLFEGQLVAV